MSQAAHVAKALDPNVRKSGDGYMVRCPAHNDNTASLKVSDGKDGKLLVRCHAGCDQPTVINELKARGLWRDAGSHHRPRSAGGTATIANDNLGSKRGGKAKQGGGKIVAEYDYFDHITGELLMQVVRYEPKGFSQRRPDPDRPNEWARTVPAECRTLYNAARAYNAKGVVLIVEGEKDVDNLAKIGVVATCNPGGAEKWQDNYNEILRDKDVVLVPDNDPQLRNKSTGALQFHPDGRPRHPGQDHADMVGAALQGIAKSIRILHLPGLPEKGDISDWLAVEGNDKTALLELINKAPRGPRRSPRPSTLTSRPSSTGRKSPPRAISPSSALATTRAATTTCPARRSRWSSCQLAPTPRTTCSVWPTCRSGPPTSTPASAAPSMLTPPRTP
jgi:hypothetical protein